MNKEPTIITETEALFVAVEQTVDIVISIHDLGGHFRMPDGSPVLSSDRTRHRHEVCLYAHSRNCLRDCQQRVNKLLGKEKKPCRFQCWKGVIEVDAPIMRNNVHIATLFAGCFQVPGFVDDNIDSGYRTHIRSLREQLPVLTDALQKKIEGQLILLGKALVHQLDLIAEQRGQPDSRKEIIRRFIDANIHKTITLADVSGHICLSQSRTCHIIQDIFGKPLKKILIEERINRATHLLANTDYPISEIAFRVGFSDVFYFSKIFKREVGVSPGKYRKKHVLSVSTMSMF